MDFEKEIKDLKEALVNRKPKSFWEAFPSIMIYTVTAVLVILKALGMITLPWIWITLFLWMPFAFVAFFLCTTTIVGIGAFIVLGFVTFFDFISKKIRGK